MAALDGTVIGEVSIVLADQRRSLQFPNQPLPVAGSSVTARPVCCSMSSFLGHINGTGPRSYSRRM